MFDKLEKGFCDVFSSLGLHQSSFVYVDATIHETLGI